MRSALYRVLELPRIYNLVQRMAGVGGTAELRALFAEIVDCREYRSVLELGCGTGQKDFTVSRFERYVRTDINELYFPSSAPPGVEFRKANAADLSCFSDGTFDLVHSAALYHHLPDEAVVMSLKESARVLADGGRIVVFDAMLPSSVYNVPAWIMRKLDRGGWVRSRAATTALLEQAGLLICSERVCSWGPKLEGCFWDAVPRHFGESLRSASAK